MNLGENYTSYTFNQKNRVKTVKVILLTSILFLTLLSTIPLDPIYGSHELSSTYPVGSGDNVLQFSIQQPATSFDKDSYKVGENATFTINESCQNKDNNIIDFFDTTVTQTSSVTTVNTIETGINSELFDGTFLTTNTLQILDDPNAGGTELLSWERCSPIVNATDIRIPMATPGEITTSGILAEEDVLACHIRPVTDILEVTVVNGTLTGDNFSVTMSFAESLEQGIFNEDDRLDFLDMFYQKPGFGWAKIADHTFDPDNSSIDLNTKTVTSDPVDAGILFPVTDGRYVIGYDVGCAGGGGGGLVRPSLVVNALAGLGGAGGGSAYSSPALQISNQVLLDWIDVPLEVEETVVNHDSTKPATAYDLGYFEDFDYPLIINDKGFILSGFTTTLETQTLKTNTPHTIKFLLYESEIIQHFSLYTNLRDATDEIHESDTQILYNANQELQVIDPNGFFESVSLIVNEIEDNKNEVVLEVTFAKEMDTSHIIVRSWDPNLFSGDTHILDAWEIISDVVVESPIPTYEEPVIEELKSQAIPIWIKNNAAWWSEQQIGDSDFVEGIEYLIKNGIIDVPGIQVVDTTTSEIPDWIKNNAGWWAESLITDDDFIQAMQWLVANGVIQI